MKRAFFAIVAVAAFSFLLGGCQEEKPKVNGYTYEVIKDYKAECTRENMRAKGWNNYSHPNYTACMEWQGKQRF